MKYITRDKTIDLLSRLIAFKSPYLDEGSIANYIYNWLVDHNLDAKLQQYSEKTILNYDGQNVLGKLTQNKEGPSIYLNGHFDTVQLCSGWKTDPFEATIQGDKLYGLGALDMKAGVAVIMLALKEFQERNNDFKGEILYSFVSDEEGPFGLGTDAVINSGFADHCDLAIVTEPSSGFSQYKFPTLSLGARGGFSYKVKFYGKAAHGANPEAGINAILDASKFALALKDIKLESDEVLGPGSNCIVGINGGGATCSVADFAAVEVFRHITLNETKTTIIKEIEQAIDNAKIKGSFDIEFRKAPSKATEGFLPYVVDQDNEYTKKLIKTIENSCDQPLTINYFSSIGDFNYIGSRLNIPTFVFGPNGENYHSANEYVLIDSVIKTSQIILDYLEKLLKN